MALEALVAVGAMDPQATASAVHGPAAVVIALGMLLIGPDHVGTLLALGVANCGMSAFKAGAAWGLGHSLAMVVVAPIFLGIMSVSSSAAQVWEHYGDYCIGFSMLLCGLYFIANEDKYLGQDADGNFVALACSCHPDAGDGKAVKFMSMAYGQRVVAFEDESGGPTQYTWKEQLFGDRGFQGMLLGALQGVACPMGLVGIQIFTKSSSGTDINLLSSCFYIMLFVLGSVVLSGLITLGWGAFTNNPILECLTPQVLYRGSCGFVAILGLLWGIATFTGLLGDIVPEPDFSQGT